MIRSSSSLVRSYAGHWIRPSLSAPTISLGHNAGHVLYRSIQIGHQSSIRAVSQLGSRPSLLTRALSTSKGDGKAEDRKMDDSSKDNNNKEEEETRELLLTPGQKVIEYSRLAFWAGVAAFGLACAYYIVLELFPSKMSPNRVFDRSFELVRKDPEILHRYGDSVKAYGRDHGGPREGRRNFVEHTKYKDEEDGSNRTRIRYNLEGRFGMAFVFAEVSDQMPSGEFVYVLVQDKSNGRVHTVVDNRAALTTQRLAAGSKEAQSAMVQLLSGGKK